MFDLTSIPIVEFDSFLKSKLISWKSVGGRVESYPQYHFGDCFICFTNNIHSNFIFSFKFYDNKIYLVLKFKPKQYKLKISDSVSFLFENEMILNYIITSEPYKAGTYAEFGTNKFPDYYEVIIPIFLKDIEIFASHKLKNWSINFKSYKLIGGDGELIWLTGRDRSKYDKALFEKKTFQEALIMFSSQFLELIKKEVPNYIEFNNNISEEECYVYLMHDFEK